MAEIPIIGGGMWQIALSSILVLGGCTVLIAVSIFLIRRYCFNIIDEIEETKRSNSQRGEKEGEKNEM